MRSGPLCKLLLSATIWGLLVGCAAGIPSQLAEQVSWNLSFREIRRQPSAYRGSVVALGGIVTHMEAVDEGYRLIFSEIPFDGSSRLRPAIDQLPRGRFILLLPRSAYRSDLRAGAEVTIVGEIVGQDRLITAGGDEEVPVLQARHVKVWGASWWPRVQINVWGGITP